MYKVLVVTGRTQTQPNGQLPGFNFNIFLRNGLIFDLVILELYRPRMMSREILLQIQKDNLILVLAYLYI